ncbi:hypothetical protein ASD15_03490 [Massilia sp. Root351]|jgi:antibiotic biosynthesis monooxygenase (ABM) superfamily enzyme|uniref:antibiotic biosynthesis monooxygenase n=1 Tax=Massilia sp. Root351 TaxID=1736522 RepID=UPI00070AB7B2|nr:antibiotic biosynthesis monooxygenase [Massilia sp. Root351]KQV91127.1 hypothetical protein ASD15_03490 [Massilia sp. Root351]
MKDSVADRAALLVRHAVRPAARGRYEAWITEVTSECRRFAGFQGTAVIRPEGRDTSYTLLVHFDSDAQLQAWVGSEQRRRLVEELRPLLLRTERLRAGVGLWFTPALAGERQPKPYKQFLLTFSAIYPLSQGVPALLRTLTEGWPLPAGAIPLLSAGLIVWLMVYVIMPRYVRAVSGWLLR